jgi:CRP/FNR family transcriptional regulator
VREVISRYISEWERLGWVRSSRGSIEVLDRDALAAYGSGDAALPRPALRSGSQA